MQTSRLYGTFTDFLFCHFYIFGVFVNIYLKVFYIYAASDCYADQYGWYIVQCWLTLHLVQHEGPVRVGTPLQVPFSF